MFEATEKETQKAILEYLEYRGVFCYRQNSGAFKTEAGGFYRMGEKGAPDIIAVIKGQFTGIEVKGPKGRQNENQKEFERRLTEAGGRYILARSLDDIVDAGI